MQKSATSQSDLKRMEEVLEQLLQIHQIDYLIADSNFQIILMSSGMQKFSPATESIELDCDVRFLLPELVGLEAEFTEVLEGRKKSYKLNCVAKEIPHIGIRYFSLNMETIQPQNNFSDCLLLSLKDITQATLIYQDIVQKSNEYYLLVSQQVS